MNIIDRIGNKQIEKVLGQRQLPEFAPGDTVRVKDHNKYVLIVAPHTSNWDFFLFIFAVSVLGLKPSVLIKDTIFIGPLGWFLRYCGAIPVNRRQANSLVTDVASIFNNSDQFVHKAPVSFRKIGEIE